jgi:hypothetical protein
MSRVNVVALFQKRTLILAVVLFTHVGCLHSDETPAETPSELRNAVTTGSIAAESHHLAVRSTSGFKVGDWVIVEIGQEAGQGRRGTRGVGGTWPSKSYTTEAQLLNDKTRSDRTFAWAEDTGYVFWWIDGRWMNMAPNRPNMFYTGQYYVGKAIPRSLQARIMQIKGNTLNIDKPAAVATKDANVYLDVAPILNTMIARSRDLTLPAGNYATGGVVWINGKEGFALAGEGKEKTTIYSPQGVPSAMIQAHNSPKTLIRDLTLRGNFRDQGFGLNWIGSTPAGTNQPVTETAIPQGAAFPRGISFHAGSHHSVVQDVRVIDVAQQAVGVSFANNVWARRVENIQNDLMRQYVQWQFQWADTTGGGCEDCEVRSTYIIPGFEAFKASDVKFIRPKGYNALMAVNGSGGWLIEDAQLEFTANSLHPESDPLATSAHHPIINVNTNIGVTAQVAKGGTIRNAKLVQRGYVSVRNDSLKGIVVNENNPNVRIENAYYAAPDYRKSSISNGAMGLNSTGLHTSVSGMTVMGAPEPGRQNIFIQRGRGENCSAQVVHGC